MAPTWLTVVAWIYISLCFICAGVIAYDIVVRGRRQPMGVMNFVFPITALYFGPFALWLYWRWARTPAPAVAREPARNGSGRVRSTTAMPELVLAGAGHEMSPRAINTRRRPPLILRTAAPHPRPRNPSGRTGRRWRSRSVIVGRDARLVT